jgi:hypothetical protein
MVNLLNGRHDDERTVGPSLSQVEILIDIAQISCELMGLAF